MAADGVMPLDRLAEYVGRIAAALERIALALEGGSAVEGPGTELPEDFPGRELLAEQGVIYFEDVPRTGAALAGLGLESRLINQILGRMRGEM